MSLFTEITINAQTIPNRIARSATNDHMGQPDGRVSDAQLREYEELAAGGAGLIFTGHMAVDPAGRADGQQNLVSDDRFLPGLAALCETVHRHGAVLYAQISHAGAKGVQPADFNAMTHAEIRRIAGEFVEAAKRLQRAGFDGVQLHLAHGYLLSQTLDDVTNRRTDEYGGSDGNRIRLARTIVEEIRAACPPSFGIAVKINANNSALVPCGERLRFYVRELERAGICAVEVSGHDFKNHPKEENAYYLREALQLKQTATVPVILVGGLNSRKTMEEALRAGIDLVSLCRSLIAEPDFPRRLQEGTETASRCQRCDACFSLFRTQYRRCVYGREEEQLRENFEKI